jgi:hypothetical protein
MHLLELPDELPLEILSYVRYGGTFDHAHSLTYRAGTQECIETQRALSETCKQLRAICEPKLYWVLIVDPTRPPWRLACYLCSVLARQELLKYLECVYATVRPDFLELSIIPDGALSQHTNDDWRRTVWRSSAWDEPRLQMETHAGRIWDKRALEEMNWSNNMKYRPEQAMLALLLGLACRTLQDLIVGAVYHQNKRGSVEAVVGTSYCPACRATFHNLQRLEIGGVWHETTVERVPTSVAPCLRLLGAKTPETSSATHLGLHGTPTFQNFWRGHTFRTHKAANDADVPA